MFRIYCSTGDIYFVRKCLHVKMYRYVINLYKQYTSIAIKNDHLGSSLFSTSAAIVHTSKTNDIDTKEYATFRYAMRWK